ARDHRYSGARRAGGLRECKRKLTFERREQGSAKRPSSVGRRFGVQQRLGPMMVDQRLNFTAQVAVVAAGLIEEWLHFARRELHRGEKQPLDVLVALRSHCAAELSSS